jgi:hypothetical protein
MPDALTRAVIVIRDGFARELDTLSFHRALLELGLVPPSRLVATFT